MGLSRRKFTKEIKLAAVQQLEAGSSAAEVARAFEINANLLHRWGKSTAMAPATLSQEWASGVGTKRKSPNWSVR
jgi:transposase-like protein